jgi:hypothetical protein
MQENPMTPRAILCASILFLTAIATAAASAEESGQIQGTWQVTRSASSDTFERFVLLLEHEGDRLSGTARWPNGDKLEVAALSFNDGKLSFSIKPGDVIQQYSGTMEGDRIRGKWAAGIAVFDWEATRDQKALQISREYVGVSEKRDFSEALASALRQMDEEVRTLAKQPCSNVKWRVAEITGQSGTPADLKIIQVKIVATFEAQGEEDAAPRAVLEGTWKFEHGALGEFDRLELSGDGTFSLEHRDVALGTTTTHGTWTHSDQKVVVLRPTRQEHEGQAVRDFRTAAEEFRVVEKEGKLVLEGKGRELTKANQQP